MIRFISDKIVELLSCYVASVVEWLVRSAAVREDAGSNPTGANVVIPVFPPKVTCPPSSNRYLAM